MQISFSWFFKRRPRARARARTRAREISESGRERDFGPNCSRPVSFHSRVASLIGGNEGNEEEQKDKKKKEITRARASIIYSSDVKRRRVRG